MIINNIGQKFIVCRAMVSRVYGKRQRAREREITTKIWYHFHLNVITNIPTAAKRFIELLFDHLSDSLKWNLKIYLQLSFVVRVLLMIYRKTFPNTYIFIQTHTNTHTHIFNWTWTMGALTRSHCIGPLIKNHKTQNRSQQFTELRQSPHTLLTIKSLTQAHCFYSSYKRAWSWEEKNFLPLS